MDNLRPYKIFLVDDDEGDYLIFKSILGDSPEWRFELTRVATFQEGVANLTKNDYDVGFVDYHLGGENGIDLIKAIRDQHIDTPLILLTGRSDLEIETAAMLAGASDFLEKGRFDFSLLLRSLRYAINRCNTLRERDKANESLRKTEEGLRQSQKMDAIGQLAGGIAHDFNNILTIIGGCSELLLKNYPLTDKARMLVEEIHSSGDRAAKLTRQLLAFSKKQQSVPEIVDVNKVVSSMENMLKRLIGEEIALVFQLNETIPCIKIDSNQLEQVFLNLTINARDAMPNGGEITITTRTADASVEVIVKDSGTGMSPEVQEHIFEPFFTTKDVGKGTGFGLATVYGIVTQAHGSINVKSELGKGSAFHLCFPAIAGKPVVEPKAEVKKDLQGKETILLVEDEDLIRKMIQKSLHENGYTVLCASDGEEALTLALNAKSEHVDLVISDVRMPKMGGRELVKGLRAQIPDLKVIYMSGYSDVAFGENGFKEDEQTQFVAKPFSPLAMLDKARTLLNRTGGKNGLR